MTTAEINRMDDHDLALRLADGDAQAFEVIYHRHRAQAFRLAMQVTGRGSAAEEATQDAFLTFWCKAQSYDSTRGAVKALLMSIVHNRSIDWVRRETRHARNVELDEARAGRLEAAERTDDQVLALTESRHTRMLLADLPKEQREAVELRYLDGLTQSEIAAATGSPLGTIKGRQRLALAKLRALCAIEVDSVQHPAAA